MTMPFSTVLIMCSILWREKKGCQSLWVAKDALYIPCDDDDDDDDDDGGDGGD